MPDIQAKLKEVDNPSAKFYKITHDDGKIEYEIDWKIKYNLR